jgi:colanic acid/amylovoran biosynthesis glycosyltransferase
MILFLSSMAPTGTGEQFSLDEVSEISSNHPGEVLLVPIRKRPGRRESTAKTCIEPVLSLKILFFAVLESIRSPKTIAKAVRVISRFDWKVVPKLVVLLPKSVWIARVVRVHHVSHIHAYWLSHTSGTAALVSAITGVPWSASGYRWDVAGPFVSGLTHERNKPTFLRVADESALEELSLLVGNRVPLILIRTGVVVPGGSETWCGTKVVVCPGHHVEKKGQRYLAEGFLKLPASLDLSLLFLGEGEPDDVVRNALSRGGERVSASGSLPIADFREFLGQVRPIVCLPSIKAESGEVEGIPVVLIEAFANGCPVVTSATGGISNLVTERLGWIVREKCPEDISRSIAEIVGNPSLAADKVRDAYLTVVETYSITSTADRLYEEIRKFCRAAG